VILKNATLLDETVKKLDAFGLSPQDVLWVAGEHHWFSWEDFKAIADVEYYSGLGSQEVAKDLVLVGKNWWMTRHEYDGAESWTYHKRPCRDQRTQATPAALTISQAKAAGHDVSCGWESLAVMNGWEKSDD
jgi:hypothetical protein